MLKIGGGVLSCVVSYVVVCEGVVVGLAFPTDLWRSRWLLSMMPRTGCGREKNSALSPPPHFSMSVLPVEKRNVDGRI